MPATMHLLALAVSVVCLGFSVWSVTRSKWREATIDLCMVVVMIAVVINQTAWWNLVSGAVLIALALGESIWSRLARRSGAAGHAHRAICLLVMGATTLAMLGHSSGTPAAMTSSHVHVETLALVGTVGLVVVVAVAIKIRSRLNVPAAGMLVATALMSVATIAA